MEYKGKLYAKVSNDTYIELKETIEDIEQLRMKANKLDKLSIIVAKEMEKEEESDLCMIGEIVANMLGYLG